MDTIESKEIFHVPSRGWIRLGHLMPSLFFNSEASETFEDNVNENVLPRPTRWLKTIPLIEKLYEVRSLPAEEIQRYTHKFGYLNACFTVRRNGSINNARVLDTVIKPVAMHKSRVFVELYEGRLNLYYSEESFFAKRKPFRRIRLRILRKSDCKHRPEVGLLPIDLEIYSVWPYHFYFKHKIYKVLTCFDPKEREDWISAICSHLFKHFLQYVSPKHVSIPVSQKKNVLLVDVGGYSIRAGLVMTEPTLPMLYFPAACCTTLVDRDSGKYRHHFGKDALTEVMRENGVISYPFGPRAHKNDFYYEYEYFEALLTCICKRLNIRPEDYKLLLVLNYPFRDPISKKVFFLSLLKFMRFKSVNIVWATLAALAGYGARTGIVIDMGRKICVTPVLNGRMVRKGHQTMLHGGDYLINQMYREIRRCTGVNANFAFEMDEYLLRYVFENLCYVEQKKRIFERSSAPAVDVQKFIRGPTAMKTLELDTLSQTRCLEGLFDSSWRPNCKSIPEMYDIALESCPLAYKFEMLQSVYLCGGLSMVPGVSERLKEVLNYNYGRTDEPEFFQFLVRIEDVSFIHAHNYRQHVGYLGAAELALSDSLDEEGITLGDFSKQEFLKYDYSMIRKLKLNRMSYVKYDEQLEKNVGKFPLDGYKTLLRSLYTGFQGKGCYYDY